MRVVFFFFPAAIYLSSAFSGVLQLIEYLQSNLAG